MGGIRKQHTFFLTHKRLRPVSRKASSTRIADMELALCKARHFVTRAADEAVNPEFKVFSDSLVERIDGLLSSTIYDRLVAAQDFHMSVSAHWLGAR